MSAALEYRIESLEAQMKILIELIENLKKVFENNLHAKGANDTPGSM